MARSVNDTDGPSNRTIASDANVFQDRRGATSSATTDASFSASTGFATCR